MTPEAPNQNGQSGTAPVNNDDIPRAGERKTPRRHIDGQTISEIARLTAKGLTESEGCRINGINPRTWFNWKSRNRTSEKFAALLEEFRAKRIADLIQRIEDSAKGKGLKQPDWRAADRLLALTDPKRFSQAAMAGQAASGVTTAQVSVLPDQRRARELLDLVYGEFTEVSGVPDRPALPAPEG